jgi:Na+/melibiose symporter-like transporter
VEARYEKRSARYHRSGLFIKLATSVTAGFSGMVLTWINYIPLTDSLGNAIPQTDPKMLSAIWAVFLHSPRALQGDFTRILYPVSDSRQAAAADDC